MSLRFAGCTRESFSAFGVALSSQPQAQKPKPRVYDKASILAYSNGKPSEAFGEPYKVFDEDRILARLPGPPFQFVDRIADVIGEPFVLAAGASCVAEYRVPKEEWYFAANRSPLMPFSVLLEIALQPCGWLAAYCGSALTSPQDLSFRNLGGQAKQHRAVTPETGLLTTTVTMTKVSSSAGMIIQHFDMKVVDREGTVYEGTTYFGFFAKEALQNQVGMPGAKVPFLSPEQLAVVEPEKLPAEEPFPEPRAGAHQGRSHGVVLPGSFLSGSRLARLTRLGIVPATSEVCCVEKMGPATKHRLADTHARY
jgi:3-hydroxymyristoyl/3-hydroxydecanoyl-(acyl carrier protein) dehydratase